MKPTQAITHQSGVILLVSMIMLLILSLIGASLGESVLMQEKMTFSVQDSKVALQSAEMALKHAENNLENLDSSIDLFDYASTTNGFYTTATAPTDYTAASNWNGDQSINATTTVDENIPAGRYFIEYIGPIGAVSNASAPITIQGYGDVIHGGQPLELFKIVVRGRGKSSTSERYITSYFGKG